MKLYEINELLENCFIVEETGEVVDASTGEMFDVGYLDRLEMERSEKIENLVLWIKNLTAEADAIKAEEKKLAQRRKVSENRVKRLKEYIAYVLQGEKFKTARCSVSHRTTRDVVTVDDLTLVPDEYFKTPHYESNLDKMRIKKELKDGNSVSGIHLQDNTSLIIR